MKRRLILALLLLSVLPAACRRRSETRFDGAPVIIISIDTLRADHLPAYGYRSVETPAFDRFRRDAILFENAWSHVPLTLPSHVSLLTGTLPPEHGVRNNIGYPFDAERHETIPSLLRKKGYTTGAAVSAYVLRGATGLGSPFDFYDDKVEMKPGQPQGEVQRDGAATAAVATKWIAGQKDRPFFFLLHIYEPHAPYAPPEPWRSRFVLPYDGEIATADAIIGRFLDDLRERKIYDRAIVVVLSDHGEGLSEHGEPEHGIFLYREDLQVPLMLKLPGSARANTTVRKPAALIDLLPTIAALTGVPSGSAKDVSLLDLDSHPARALYAETLYPRIHLGWSELRSLVDDRFHFIQAPRPELYDLGRDPREQANALESERRVYARMREALGSYGAGIQAPSKIDPEEAKKLAALGYLSATATPSAGPLPDPKDRIGEIALLGEANRRDAAGDVAGAIAAFEGVLAKNPGLTDAWSLLAKAQEKNGRLPEAIESYRRAIQLAPALAGENALSIASLALQLNRVDEAESHARLAEKANPSEAHVVLGRVALARHDVAGAGEEARKALAAQAANPHASLLLAQVYTQTKRFDEAMTIIDRVAAENTDKPPLQFLEFVRGDILGRTNRVPDAVEAFRREIRAFPHGRQAYANLAALYFFAGGRDDARQTMESFVRAVPAPSSYAFAAETFEQFGDTATARAFRRRGR